MYGNTIYHNYAYSFYHNIMLLREDIACHIATIKSYIRQETVQLPAMLHLPLNMDIYKHFGISPLIIGTIYSRNSYRIYCIFYSKTY